MGISDIVKLFGGIALFLFGMNLMGNGLKKVAGDKLEVILYKLTSSPLKGILLGTGVTAVIQSSSATSVMVVGFVNSGMMKVKQAIGIIMGAIIGTSITGWVICLSEISGSGVFEIFSTDGLTALLSVIGIILLLFTNKEQNHNIATILLGFAVLMFGISTMSDAVYPLRESETFISMLTNFSNPFIGILIGLLFTCLIQSASAAVGILQALSITGAIDFKLALPIIMGIAIGASVPVLLSALGANANGKRTALIYLLVDTLGALIFGIIFYGVNAIFIFSFMNIPMNMISIALLNTIFRIIIILMLAPFIGILEKIVAALVREKNEKIAELQDADRLEERFLKYPALAIEQTRIAINSMAELAYENLIGAIDLIENYSEEGYDRTAELEGIVDTYEDKIGNYIVKIMKTELNEEQNKTVSLFLHSVNDFERLSDHSVNISDSAKEIHEKKIIFSEMAKKEISTLLRAIKTILDNTKTAFINDDIALSHRIAPLEELIDNLCDEYKLHHIERVQNGTCEYKHSFVYNDMLTDLERVGDHCSNIGIAMRMKHSELNERHGAVSRIELEKAHHFDEYYQEYLKMFS